MTTNEPLKNIFVWCIINLINSVKFGELSAIFCSFFFVFYLFVCFFYNLLEMIILSHIFSITFTENHALIHPFDKSFVRKHQSEIVINDSKVRQKNVSCEKNLLLHLNLIQNLSQHFLLYCLSMCM